MIGILIYLLFFHFLLDYALQGDFVSRAKNKYDPVAHVPWYHVMFAHTALHGIAVYLVTGLPLLGIAELIIHWWTDQHKCKGELTFGQDQAIHIVSKIVWAYVAAAALL